MNEPLDDFLEQIKSTLLSHEEPYDKGAWERFAANNIPTTKKRSSTGVIPIWKWAAAAAAILAGAILLSQYLISPNKTRDAAVANHPTITNGKNTTTMPEQGTISIPTDSNTVTADITGNIHTENANSHIKKMDAGKHALTGTDYNLNKSNDNTFLNVPKNDAIAHQPVPSPLPPQQPQQTGEQTNIPFYKNKIVTDDVAKSTTPLPKDNRNTNNIPTQTADVHKKQGSSRWLSSLYVSPTFGSHDVNMGYGYQLGYAVNDKVRISSGIAYTKVSASKNYNAPEPPSAAMAAMDNAPVNAAFTSARSVKVLESSTPYLKSVDAWVSGIDVPVEVHYKISKKLYAAGGVSGLFVLGGKDTRTYIDDRNYRVTVETAQGKVKEDKLVQSYNVAPVQSDVESTPFLGFYNLSMGYKQKISGKNSVSLEPFIKVPMKQVTDQKLNYTGVGIRLKFDF